MLLQALLALASLAHASLLFGLGTTFDGRDFAVTLWEARLTIVFEGTCVAEYAVSRWTSAVSTQSSCAPLCFRRLTLETHARGVLHLVPTDERCEPEAARVRAADWVNETTQRFLSDTDVMYFETFSV